LSVDFSGQHPYDGAVPEMTKDELAQLLVSETGVEFDEAYKVLESPDPGVQRMVHSIINAVEERPEFRETMARHRARIRSAVAI